jgi:3-hydroxybutyryl-CoA dehydrogenase
MNNDSPVKEIAIIGAGQMGAGIAQVCAMANFTTYLWDNEQNRLLKGHKDIDERLNALFDKKKLTEEDYHIVQNNLKKTQSLEEAVKNCDIIIEAIVENFEAKKNLFINLDQLAKPSAILASNTSSISITKIAAVTSRPPRVIGIHFMNPVPQMKLVEIIPGLQTDPCTIETAISLVKQLKKSHVIAIDAPGFIINRVLCPMINEAIFLLQQGCNKEDIDQGMKLGTNQPMGPLELADFVGLDTLHAILTILHQELGEDKYRPCSLLTKYVEAGWFGRKTGQGFYKY